MAVSGYLICIYRRIRIKIIPMRMEIGLLINMHLPRIIIR